jgi:SAM-dependent methyltransferase
VTFLGSLRHRQRQIEWMDRADADPRQLARSLAFIRRVNRWLGYTRATLAHLERFSRHWRPGQKIRIIDLATGSADIPRAILRWADRRGFDISVVAIDRHAVTARAAGAAGPRDPRLLIVQADVFDLPFDPLSFDYALTAMFLHHLDDEAVIGVMQRMDGLARRGVIVADLLRGRRAFAWIWLFTLLANPMVRHDARASVRQALDRGEILALRDRAGLQYAAYHRHFGHRFVLAGEKNSAADQRRAAGALNGQGCGRG